MALLKSEEKTVQDHLMKGESIVDSYSGPKEAVAVTNVHLLRVKDRNSSQHVDSTLLKGPHVVGSNVVSKTGYESNSLFLGGFWSVWGSRRRPSS